MTWRPIDCHAHTTLSDGALTVAELVEVVCARGVRPSVSDHVSTDVGAGVKSVEAVRRYLDELEAYPDVGRGGEFCWHDSLWRELPEALAARFTHRIGSLHAIFIPGLTRPLHLFAPTLPEGLTIDRYMDAHLDNLERLAREMPVDILAHPTLLPLAFRDCPLEEVWTEPREERAVEALYRAGIAFEISARYRPHRRLVQRAHERGVRLALGSDGHTWEQVGDLSFPMAMARAVGAKPEELYDPFVHGSRPWRVGDRSPIPTLER
jgi:histidinol phosphatase-like PHP family hydrolase